VKLKYLILFLVCISLVFALVNAEEGFRKTTWLDEFLFKLSKFKFKLFAVWFRENCEQAITEDECISNNYEYTWGYCIPEGEPEDMCVGLSQSECYNKCIRLYGEAPECSIEDELRCVPNYPTRIEVCKNGRWELYVYQCENGYHCVKESTYSVSCEPDVVVTTTIPTAGLCDDDSDLGHSYCTGGSNNREYKICMYPPKDNWDYRYCDLGFECWQYSTHYAACQQVYTTTRPTEKIVCWIPKQEGTEITVDCCPEGYSVKALTCDSNKCCEGLSCQGGWFEDDTCLPHTDINKIKVEKICWMLGDECLPNNYKINVGKEVYLYTKISSEISQRVKINYEIKESDPEFDDFVYKTEAKDYSLSSAPIIIKKKWTVPALEDGWFGASGDAEFYFHPLFNNIERTGKDNSPMLVVRKPTEGETLGLTLVDWGFYVNGEKVNQVPEGTIFTAKAKVKALKPVEGYLKLILKSDSWIWFDAVKKTEEKYITLTTDETTEISLNYRASQDSSLHQETYHLDILFEGKEIVDRLPADSTEDIAVVKGVVLVGEYGWFKDNIKVKDVGSGETAIARAVFENIADVPATASAKIVIRQDKKWASDETVKTLERPMSLSSGSQAVLDCPFAGEDRTSYHFEVYWGKDKLVERSPSVCFGDPILHCRDPLDWIWDLVIGRNWVYFVIIGAILIGLFLFLVFLLPLLVPALRAFLEIRALLKR